MNLRLSSLLLACMLLLSSCEVKMPEDVIAPERMERLLYDYHLVQSMTSEYSSAEYKEKLFYDYVFRKHGVTKERFESSMQWYNRYPKHLQKVYAALEARLEAEVEELDAMGVSQELAIVLDEARLSADSAELWAGPRNSILSSTHLYSHMAFGLEVPEDVSFAAGDSLSFSFDALFVNGGRDVAQKAHAAILVKYSDGTSGSNGVDITSSGKYSVGVKRHSEGTIVSLSGFVYYSDNGSLSMAKMLLGNISLNRTAPARQETSEE